MSNSSIRDEIPQPVVGLPGCMFNNGLTTAQSNNVGSAKLISLLLEWGDEQQRETRGAQGTQINTCSHEINTPLQKVSAGPWMSCGGYFDYSDWAARERFVELDKAIAGSAIIKELNFDQ
jgi:hypothetical protein